MPAIRTLTNGKIAIVTPWNAAVIEAAKAKMGRWMRVNAERPYDAWVLDASHRPAMESLIADLFPPRESLIERVIAFQCAGYSNNAPTVDGYALVEFSRDRRWWKRFEAGEPIEIVEILEDSLDTGGSRNNPRLLGRCVVRVRCRPQAEASWESGQVEVVS